MINVRDDLVGDVYLVRAERRKRLTRELVGRSWGGGPWILTWA